MNEVTAYYPVCHEINQIQRTITEIILVIIKRHGCLICDFIKIIHTVLLDIVICCKHFKETNNNRQSITIWCILLFYILPEITQVKLTCFHIHFIHIYL